MALANPPAPLQSSPIQMPSSLDQFSSIQQSLLLLASSPMASRLFLAHQANLLPGSFLSPSNAALIQPGLLPPLTSMGQGQQQFQIDCSEMDATETVALHQMQLSKQPALGGIPPPSLPFQSAQQLVDRNILELLLAKTNNALSLFGLSNLAAAALLPTPTLAPNAFTPIPLRREGTAILALDNSPVLENGERKSSVGQLESQLESLSRNKLGRSYNPGRPLGLLDRQKILELYQKGLKISHIAKVIGVTHSCVSKIMTRYRRTGSIHPRSAQLSLLSRRQTSALVVPNSSAKNIATLELPSDWQQWMASTNAEELTTLKCSVPSAFQRICCGAPSGEEREEGRSSSSIGSMEEQQLLEETLGQKEQKPYLVQSRLLD